ncbi:hypothetical protein BDW02DRAFT_428191 [Decorospora gaudefroyi]|uniref:DUF7707 domain-containing protein n=1 Tax=Decorospora gaudefroyi TaxID=184978 RepID=A0A6A5K3T7_9PLEO|nr:hypothetical protein BDW02DRAFT_428191 [Decorospora gaudefroyi]
MRSIFALSIAAFAGITAAQSTTQADYPYTIDPETVDEPTREYWCSQNEAQCPHICLQQPGVTSMTTEENSCDSDTLTYSCICENGVSPNITQFSQTLPYFICTEWGQNCVAACGGDNSCQSACLEDHPCGAQNPFLGNVSASAAMSSTAAPSGSATSGIPISGFGGASPTDDSNPTTNPDGAGAVFAPNAALGLGALFGSVFLGFAVLL